jgi:hypothetical protein
MEQDTIGQWRPKSEPDKLSLIIILMQIFSRSLELYARHVLLPHAALQPYWNIGQIVVANGR